MSPFELIISYASGELYWKDFFQDKESLNSWLEKEKSKAYWKNDWLVEVKDNTPVLNEQKRLLQEEARRKKEEKENEIKNLENIRKRPSGDILELDRKINDLIDYVLRKDG